MIIDCEKLYSIIEKECYGEYKDKYLKDLKDTLDIHSERGAEELEELIVFQVTEALEMYYQKKINSLAKQMAE